jgi:ferritin
MLSSKLTKAINDQINLELNSAYLYLSMVAHFEAHDLPGFAEWMKQQWTEEVEHGMKLLGYLQTRNGSITLDKIDKPQSDFGDPLAVFEQVLAHEQKVTAAINKLYGVAVDEKDYAAQSFLQWFVNEQVEEEATAEEVIRQLKMIEGKKHLLLMLDRKMGQRGAA